jgi:hypothetical protein
LRLRYDEIEWRQLRNIIAREIINALIRDGFLLSTNAALISVTATPTGAGSL